MLTQTVWTKVIRILLAAELLIGLSWFFSPAWFINLQVASLSSLLIILGSMRSYYTMVQKRVENHLSSDTRDTIDQIDDPFDLYSDDILPEASMESVDIKQVIKEEKKKLKGANTKHTIASMPALFSLYRLGGYLFLVGGFFALKQNNSLMIAPYLIGLAIGLVFGVLLGRMIIKPAISK